MHVATQAIRPRLEIVAEAPVPTRFGEFRMMVFHWNDLPPPGGSAGAIDGMEPALTPVAPASSLSPDHVALVMGDVRGRSGVTVRVHSECLTGEVFGSLKCDCQPQLEAAQKEVARRGSGVILYLRQEGRGIGLSNKIRAYSLQAMGHDTVDANRMLSLPDDARDYAPAAAMLQHLGVASVRLLTNNPLKEQGLRALGVDVVERVASVVSPNRHSVGYLEAKRLRMGHSLPSYADGDDASSLAG